MGDLRGRASRMEEIASLEQLQGFLKDLVDRKLVVYLTEPDRRGAMVTHGFHATEEMPAIAALAAGFSSAMPVTTPRPAASPNEIEQLKNDVAELRKQLMDLRRELGLATA